MRGTTAANAGADAGVEHCLVLSPWATAPPRWHDYTPISTAGSTGRANSMNKNVGWAVLLGVLLLVISMNFSRSPNSTSKFSMSAQMSEQLNSMATRWGSGGEASVLKEEVTELRKRVKDLERHLTLIRTQSAAPAAQARQLAPKAVDAPAAQVEAPAATAVAAAAAAAAPPVTTVAVVGAARAVITAPAVPAGATRQAAPTPEGVVGMASWWSEQEVQVASGAWCRMPPPYAQPKPALPELPAVEEKPLLTSALAKKHASEDNLLIATYVNFNRLDFAFTLVKHLFWLKGASALSEDSVSLPGGPKGSGRSCC